ncbi:hypothetical protein JEY40_31745 [Bradyrhizobium japonicum]|uniref:hypothetical protein n=1 Tax=Bradyrhizobium japonicum TaxID=375 RepID=UPI00200E6233|nr:hypothetical protein [Bradyrhizobium japonicum]UQD70498.1 hypothetical protein JEY40_31745 [Bradyrhizobium japonicum]
MFDRAPARATLTLRLREETARDLKREAAKREIPLSEEVRRRLEFYAAHHTEKPARACAK